jgi:hypothetical protein
MLALLIKATGLANRVWQAESSFVQRGFSISEISANKILKFANICSANIKY